jgi:hypothetical protein
MTKAQWFLAASPSIALLALLLLDLVPHQWGVIYVVLAFLQGAFILATIQRVRGNVPNHGSKQSTMPVWQKVVLSAIAIYGLFLIIIGGLTKQ